MALNKSNLLIRDYDNIRHILRDIYIFGCLSRDDFVEMGISGRKYDMEQYRIHAYLPEGFIQKRRVGKKVLQYCSYNPIDCPENYLAETFRNKSFTLLDIMAYFYTLQLLGNEEEWTLPMLLKQIPEVNEQISFTKDNLRIKLEELEEAGLIQIKKEGRSVTYSLSEDIWKEFSNEELLDIYDYLEFLKNILPLEMPFFYLQKKLRLYLSCERGMEVIEQKIFLFRHNHLFHALDNEILFFILKAINQKRYIQIKMRYHGEKQAIVPVKVIHDSTYGRQYLLGYDFKKARIHSIRLDKLDMVESDEAVTEEEWNQAEQICEAQKECFSTSGANNEPVLVEIEFRFDEEKEAFILERIQREGHGGFLERRGEGCYYYSLMVRDPIEMVPWIRSFGERARVLSSGHYRIEERIAQDWRKAVEKYEALS